MKFLKVLMVSALLWSCQNVDEIKEPDNLIPEDKMVDVLTELNLLNSAKNFNKRILEETGLQPDTYFFNKYKIDSLQLAESTSYYAKKYDKFDGIYQRVRQNLEGMKERLDVIRAEEQRIEDSLRNSEKLKDSLALDTLNKFETELIDSLGLVPAVYEGENY